MEQEQQKRINWMSPSDESTLELTIGYEHLAVDLTAWLAMHEPDEYAKACMDFALLEDFDHLYRYADQLKFDEDIPAHKLVRDYVEITPGRPTIAHHRHPADSVRMPRNSKTGDMRTTLGALILTAGEQQTMNFYMNLGNTVPEGPGRDLYQEIGMVEEQHVTHYGSLIDPSMTWLEMMLWHEYQECYLYYSFYETEVDNYVKKMWEMHFEQECMHLAMVSDLLQKYDGTEYQQIIPDGEFPELLDFHPTKDYVRQVLAEQVTLTAQDEEFADIDDVPSDFRYFEWNDAVKGRTQDVPSHKAIRQLIEKDGEDYRSEDAKSPIPELRNRKQDDTKLARVQGYGKKAHEVEQQAKEEREAVLA